jgi:hypothetical protein
VFHELRSPLHFITLAVTGIKASLEDLIAMPKPCQAAECALIPVRVALPRTPIITATALPQAPTALAAFCGFDLCHKYILYLCVYYISSRAHELCSSDLFHAGLCTRNFITLPLTLQAAAQGTLQTIAACADAVRSARRILDDVLSLSKMVRWTRCLACR